MQKTVAKMIRQYGTTMVLVKDEQEQTIQAFLQETRSKSHENTDRTFSLLGEMPSGMFVYLGPADPAADVGDHLLYEERVFELRRAELIMAGEQALYCWGICVETGGDNIWGK